MQVDTAIGENAGDFYHRTYAPGVAMATCDHTYVINFNNVHHRRKEVMQEAEVLVLNNVCDPDFLPLIRDRRSQGKLTVFELCDDLDDVPPGSPVRAFYENPEHRLLFKRLAGYCDAMQFSSETLRAKYGHLNPISRVFPNHILEIPPEKQFARTPEVVVGWGGSSGHTEDLARIAEPLTRWILSRSDVKLHLMCYDPIWEFFRDLPDHRKRRFETGSLAEYYRFLSTLHIGFAPLQDTAFNKSRSDIKFLEYAVSGVVPLMQAAGPYPDVVRHGRTGFLFHNTDELISLLETLVSQPSQRIAVAMGARDYVLRERLHVDHAKDRTEFYRAGLRSLSTRQGRKTELVEKFEAFASTRGAHRNGRHLLFNSTRFELLLWGGLLAMDIPDPAKASRMFLEAMELEPDNYLPHLFGAYAFTDRIASLKQAARKNPQSIKAWLLLGEECYKRGDLVQSLESFEAAATVFPEYELPYLKMADALRDSGLEKERLALMRKARDLLREAFHDKV